MFRKKEDIEQDFIAYGTSNTPTPSSGGILGKLIQLLSVLVLLGVVTLMGMFGYKYWQNEFASNPPRHPITTPGATPIAQSADTAQPAAANPKEKLYTQEEMQAIVMMLMQQMQNRQKESDLAKPAQSPKAQNIKTPKKTPTEPVTVSGMPEEDTEALVSALNEVKIEGLDPADTDTPPSDSRRYNQAKAQKSADKPGDNKVIINPSKNSYDNIANLSKEIGSIVKSMQKKSTSAYTKSIQKEITTRTQEMRFIVVQKGDTLSKIAQRAYGNAMAFDIILEANPDLIKNPNHIYVGQRLRVPLVKK